MEMVTVVCRIEKSGWENKLGLGRRPESVCGQMRSSPAICKADVLQKILDGLEHRHVWDCGVCGVGNGSSVHSSLSPIFHMCSHCNFNFLKSTCRRHEIHEVSCFFEIISIQ